MTKAQHAGGLIEPGEPAPDFELQDQHEQTHRLSDYRGQWVVLYFYPTDSTPGCTKQACQFRDTHTDWQRVDAVVLGVSRDSVRKHRNFAEKQGLNFPLLADTGETVCKAYGVLKPKTMFGKPVVGIARTTYLIDPQGKVAQRWDKVKVDGHAAAVMEKVQELKGS